MIATPDDEPRAELSRRLADRRARAVGHEARALSLIRLQFALTFVALALGWASCDRHLLPRPWVLLPLAAVVAAGIARGRVLRARARARRAARFYEDSLARIDGTFAGGPDMGDRYLIPDHPFAADLDLFGPGSLFTALCSARTAEGKDTFARWLTAPAAVDDARARQAAVAELGPALDFRESLVEGGEAIHRELRTRSLLAWALEPSPPVGPGARAGTWALTAVGVTFLGLFFTEHFVLAALVGVVQVALASRLGVPVAKIGAGVFQRSSDLRVLSELVVRIEKASFTSPLLAEVHRDLTGGAGAGTADKASRRIARLSRLVAWFDSRRNVMFGVPTAPLMLGSHLAIAIAAWRRQFGPAVARWIRAVGTVEAIATLGAFSYENPGYPFPTLVPAGQGPVVQGHALGHPLIPADRRVANDVDLGGDRRLLVVSGSNMSGKSTYMRTVGTNVVLALAGAPVCAADLRVSFLEIGATLRISDSLQQGRSRFFAEITRIKQIVDRAGAGPTLFLLDEILHGTNSHDRRLGAQGVIATLVDRGAIGIVTTHDLALTRLGDDLPNATNVHFQDHIENGELVFDYRMRPGTVTRSNALALMRLVGLEIPPGIDEAGAAS